MLRIDSSQTGDEGTNPGTDARSVFVSGEEGLGQGSQAARLGFLGALEA